MSGNRWLRQAIQDLRKVLKLTRLFSLSIEGRLQQSLAEHAAILAAIRAGDATTRADHDARSHPGGAAGARQEPGAGRSAMS
jgi:DNA-binding FadR family transcriptional regulator